MKTIKLLSKTNYYRKYLDLPASFLTFGKE